MTTRTMKQYRAISPSMNDQWSGKTLLSDRRANVAAPSRSSNHPNIRFVIAPLRCFGAFPAFADSAFLVACSSPASLTARHPGPRTPARPAR